MNKQEQLYSLHSHSSRSIRPGYYFLHNSLHGLVNKPHTATHIYIHSLYHPQARELGQRINATTTTTTTATTTAATTTAPTPSIDRSVGANEVASANVDSVELCSSSVSVERLQLVFVISDARIQQDRDVLSRWTREALNRGQLIVLIILDCSNNNNNNNNNTSISNTQIVHYDTDTYSHSHFQASNAPASSARGKLRLSSYLDDFPFPYYLIVRNIEVLPEVVSEALTQWFELIRQQQDY